VRLRILSDLHVECFQEGRDLPDVTADVVILAGDIHRTTEGLAWAALTPFEQGSQHTAQDTLCNFATHCTRYAFCHGFKNPLA